MYHVACCLLPQTRKWMRWKRVERKECPESKSNRRMGIIRVCWEEYIRFRNGQNHPWIVFVLSQKSVILSLLTRIIRAEKKEMTPVIREYTINLNKACHKV